jgi:hypothetical protein
MVTKTKKDLVELFFMSLGLFLIPTSLTLIYMYVFTPTLIVRGLAPIVLMLVALPTCTIALAWAINNDPGKVA